MRKLLPLLFCLPLIADEGFATFYTVKSCQREGTSGVFTANGEKYDEAALTCALPIRKSSKDFGKCWKVTNVETGQSVVVRQNDYGPGILPRKRGVVIDLTPAAYAAVGGQVNKGRVKVTVERFLPPIRDQTVKPQDHSSNLNSGEHKLPSSRDRPKQ